MDDRLIRRLRAVTGVAIGRCPVCARVRRLLGGGCAECVARFGERLVRTAARVRGDARFRALCRGLLSEHRRPAFDEQFGEGDGVATNPPVGRK